ncbi:Uncharacterized protein APZ42_022358 [Daphnia magna]|uniref:Uncharacterized protein n=1 Tax=Daphnia magna TaxID=35525 RepID=A0A164VF41_9CRUS|nr:Uncharacterized protein APZ42_022358 [Daphnia magna]
MCSFCRDTIRSVDIGDAVMRLDEERTIRISYHDDRYSSKIFRRSIKTTSYLK